MGDYLLYKEEQAEKLRNMPELLSDSGLADGFRDFLDRSDQELQAIFQKRSHVVNLMEDIRREDWRRLRACLTVLRDNLDSLALDKQEIVLGFLSDLLSHESGMVRRITAATYGYFLAYRQKKYQVSPEEEIHRVLFPGASVSVAERRRINYQLKYILRGFVQVAEEGQIRQLLNYIAGFFKSSRWDKITCFYLITGIFDIPCESWSSLHSFHIFSFLRNQIDNNDSDNEEVRLAALYLIWIWMDQGWRPPEEAVHYLRGLRPAAEAKYCEKYVIRKIQGSDQIGLEEEEEGLRPDIINIMRLFQENQHSHALWINKIMNLSILKEYFFQLQEEGRGENPYCFQYANHLISTLRLNKQAVVFLQAGEDLMEIMPYLASYQKFEIVKDILQSLENADDYYNFMAPFAGKAFLCLEPSDQEELIPRFWELVDRLDSRVVNTSLEVVAEIFRNYYTRKEAYQGKSQEEKDTLFRVMKNLSSIMSTGMASFNPRIARETFFLTGETIFARVDLADEERVSVLLRLARKALISLNQKNSSVYDVYNFSAIKQIAENLRRNEGLIRSLEKPRKPAFFSGSFDPFSRGHKAIAREVSEMGYTVYLDAHDFSWYKKLQPKEIRRQIIYLSISDLEHVVLFPDDYPISYENPEDLAFLRSLFPDREVTIVTGSDMVESCEAYWKEAEKDSIHTFPHIIFQRGAGLGRDLVDPLIQAETQFLRVPEYFDTMTSAEIQRQITLGRDISDLVDRQVCNYVLEKKLYRSEPLYKKIAKTRPLDFFSLPEKGQDQRLCMANMGDGPDKTICSVTWHETGAACLYDECRDYEMTQVLRRYVSGRILVITGISAGRGEGAEKPVSQNDYMIVCNELLAMNQKREYSYGIYFEPDAEAEDLLKRFGFIQVPESGGACYYVDLRHPITMFYDAESFIKEPYCQDESISQVIKSGKERLQQVVPDLYPGNLILHFEAAVINYRLIRLITEANQVSEESEAYLDEEGNPLSYDNFGEKMCVPFGKLLKGVLVPNTVTKELNIEKLYESDLHSFEISEFPDYELLATQIRTVKAFRRPTIFVDDLYHKGYRMKKIHKLLKEEGTGLDRFMVGVLSGQGRDLARELGLKVEAPYLIPDMRAWIVESDLYPFLGGDGIKSDDEKREGIIGLPSINLILPYQIPKFLRGSSLQVINRLSEAAIKNAREIFRTLETLYRKEHYHSLTFGRIGEVMAEPRYPDGSVAVIHNNQLVSEILSAELARLYRLNI